MKRVSRLSSMFIVLLLSFSLMLPTIAGAAAPKVVAAKSAEVELSFDGSTLRLPDGQFVFVVKGTTYVPLRFVSYALQKNVSWDNDSATVSISNPSKEQKEKLQQYLDKLKVKKGQKASKVGVAKRLTVKSADFLFDREKKALPKGQTSYILNGSLYVPVRFVSESLGVKITWNQQNKSITAVTQDKQSSKPDKEQNGSDNGSTKPETPVTTPEGGNTGAIPGGGGGTAPSKPTEASIIADADSKISALKSKGNKEFGDILINFINQDITRQEAIAQGNVKLSEMTSSFESIMSDLEKQLGANGYSTTIVQEYRDKFNEEINKQKESLKSKNV